MIVCSSRQMMRLLHTILFVSVLVVVYTEIVEATTTGNKSVEVTKGINGLEKVILRQTHGSSVEVYLYGAHVTSWKNEQGEELIFLSSKAIFSPPKPIRGGIPTVFPQFSNLGSLQSHGFARNRFWTIDNKPSPDTFKVTNGVFVDLLLKPTEEDLKIWPHRFEFRMRVTLTPGGDLVLTSCIRNTDDVGKPFTFTFAHHTYFSVSNISEVEVKGMAKLDYLDNLQNRTRFTETKDTITIDSEFDRIYLSTPKKVAVLDHGNKRTVFVRKDGLPDAVVWNPWEKKAKTIVDLREDEYKYMIAVEAAAIEKPVTLQPGEEWKGRLELSTRH
ncbi:putative glucose-6-phosphate 1-epimerase [Helianthus annuus]|uniref:glucose-6-phosphate 1-epimerase n=1 Tax=Helianthus annuus TaxID=4232 RepID=A0A251UPA6_HELAN|nr:putative glucose-6-phosphate 1-epimerase [Helianthus annuus]KAF5804800.1 putative glucose-6-phosphate 1-epimerase [Helianthus annuus]KAJ0575831.1 putative glucose-6-phosphate 1-epimerase [Helianthus annuus]KAJ0583685.1 putative glucose-6-phosphate 1-epimerase [Helianthus annuus]KAJ0749414.1 putative glucose-6-phosphate 1-epimerase [Helianthus annuus]KAJ0917891.1 putative glucose-6-phosphate 1-epimerase [Helianthus annuus]